MAGEIERLEWADIVIVQFPLWWFRPPAILKGWLDRVLVNGFVIGVSKPGTRPWLRYGEGRLVGRRGLLAVTAGGREAQFSRRGINGPNEDFLFPLDHGVFHYTGMSALEPFVTFSAARASTPDFMDISDRYIRRLLGAPHEAPMHYRSENGDDYDELGRLQYDVATGLDGYRPHVI